MPYKGLVSAREFPARPVLLVTFLRLLGALQRPRLSKRIPDPACAPIGFPFRKVFSVFFRRVHFYRYYSSHFEYTHINFVEKNRNLLHIKNPFRIRFEHVSSYVSDLRFETWSNLPRFIRFTFQAYVSYVSTTNFKAFQSRFENTFRNPRFTFHVSCN